MKIKIEPHTLRRAEERGTNSDEITDVINNGSDIPAKHGRLAKTIIYPFQQSRLGKYYEHKKVEVIYTIEREQVVTITVYVFYGKWED